MVSKSLACSRGVLGLGGLARRVDVVSELRADSEGSVGVSSLRNVRGADDSARQQVDHFLALGFNGASIR